MACHGDDKKNKLPLLRTGFKAPCAIPTGFTHGIIIDMERKVIYFETAGTARGADAVMVLKSSASKRFLDLKVLEVLVHDFLI